MIREQFQKELLAGQGVLRIEASNVDGTDFIEGIFTLRASDGVTDVRWRLPERLFGNEELLAGILRELTLEFEEYRARNEARGRYQ